MRVTNEDWVEARAKGVHPIELVAGRLLLGYHVQCILSPATATGRRRLHVCVPGEQAWVYRVPAVFDVLEDAARRLEDDIQWAVEGVLIRDPNMAFSRTRWCDVLARK